MAIDYSGFAIPKPEPRCVTKKRQQKEDQRNERACREIVKARDRGRCRVPNCNERDVEMHHLIPRSHSRKRKWDPKNNALLCKGHHDLRHAGRMQITGDADGELVITGDINALRFRL